MTAHIPTAHEIETASGRYVDTHRPQPSTICVEDIAHHLSHVCRYGGACSRYYSVAEHAVLVAKRLREQGWDPMVQLAGLHHDDAEAFLGDIPRPMKPLLGPVYTDLTERMDEAICEALWVDNEGLPMLIPGDFHMPEVKAADTWALFVEARHLLPSKGINWTGSFDAWGMAAASAEAIDAAEDPWFWIPNELAPAGARGLFLDLHRKLIREASS